MPCIQSPPSLIMLFHRTEHHAPYRLSLISLCLMAAIGLIAVSAIDSQATPPLVKVNVHRLIIDPGSQQPVVVLADAQETRALLIWIDFFEANAIQAEMEGISHRRPLTHDLLEKIIQQNQGEIEQIIITHMAENIYYATLVLMRGSERVEIDARPSDSIVMALKFKSPIYVTQTLFEERAIALAKSKTAAEQYGLTLQDITPALAQYFRLGTSKGALVAGVRPGSPAEADGIEDGDIFLSVDGKTIRDASSMVDVIAEGSDVKLKAKVLRKERKLSLTLNLNP